MLTYIDSNIFLYLGARDSIHAASALIAGARTLISEDRDFDGIPKLNRRSAG